jgi:gas vesicle protein
LLLFCFSGFEFFDVSLCGNSIGAFIGFIAVSLVFPSVGAGLTGGMQKRIKEQSKKLGIKAKPYDFMFWTNW